MMKLSQLTTDRAADVLCRLAPHVMNIIGDENLLNVLKDKVHNNKWSVAEIYAYGAKKISSLLLIVLENHRDDVFNILAIMNDSDVNSIAKQNFMVTLEQAKDVILDKDMIDFFVSWRQWGRTK